MFSYIVEATAAHIRVLGTNNTGGTQELERFVHPMDPNPSAARGRASGKHSRGQEQDSRSVYFAQVLASYLSRAPRHQRSTAFLVAAPPRFIVLLQTLLAQSRVSFSTVHADQMLDDDSGALLEAVNAKRLSLLGVLVQTPEAALENSDSHQVAQLKTEESAKTLH